MTKILAFLFIFIPLLQPIFSQQASIPGKPIAEIFTDYHYIINDTTRNSGFGINRAWLGYNFLPAENFSATMIVNVGNPEDLTPGAKRRRYAFFREASLSWRNDNLSISLGITGTRIFTVQQNFWNKSYVSDFYQVTNGYGYLADLGLAVDYKFNDVFKADFTLMNGEGYSEIQYDNGLKYSLGLTVTPNKALTLRAYHDLNRTNKMWQMTLVGFAGIRYGVISCGIEGTYKSNADMLTGHDAWGIAGTGAVTIIKNTEFFTTYEYFSSTSYDEALNVWDKLKDGNTIIFGFQYTFNQYVKLALDYQGKYSSNLLEKNYNGIFFNALFKY